MRDLRSRPHDYVFAKQVCKPEDSASRNLLVCALPTELVRNIFSLDCRLCFMCDLRSRPHDYVFAKQVCKPEDSASRNLLVCALPTELVRNIFSLDCRLCFMRDLRSQTHCRLTNLIGF